MRCGLCDNESNLLTMRERELYCDACLMVAGGQGRSPVAVARDGTAAIWLSLIAIVAALYWLDPWLLRDCIVASCMFVAGAMWGGKERPIHATD